MIRPILTLSLGPQFGWALRWDQDHVASGVQPFGWEPATFGRWLRDLLALSEARVVAWTRPEPASRRQRRRAAAALRLEGVLLAELEGRVHLLTPSATEVALHATGRGAPAQRDLVVAARGRWQRPVESAREAAALCTLAWAADFVLRIRRAS